MKKLVLAVFVLFFANVSYAGTCNPDACVKVLIDRLYPDTTGKIYIGTNGNESILNCNAVSGVYLYFTEDTKNADIMYSTLLAAQLASKPVTIQVDDDSDGCLVQYIVLDR